MSHRRLCKKYVGYRPTAFILNLNLVEIQVPSVIVKLSKKDNWFDSRNWYTINDYLIILRDDIAQWIFCNNFVFTHFCKDITNLIKLFVLIIISIQIFLYRYMYKVQSKYSPSALCTLVIVLVVHKANLFLRKCSSSGGNYEILEKNVSHFSYIRYKNWQRKEKIISRESGFGHLLFKSGRIYPTQLNPV